MNPDALHWLGLAFFILGHGLLGWAGWLAAQRKGRHSWGWALVCGVFAPSLLLLELLPPRPGSQRVEERQISPYHPHISMTWVEIMAMVVLAMSLTFTFKHWQAILYS
ncbi:hypothetical protein E3E12_08730 [Formicincola oecophyllae]|uniref:Uncharacterized protein n=1 Tax=Formicincola oecophyllae TaxID=2558361 RepID=A0A5B9M8P9_9PROT|nr:hypothetical protein [Formicincola oecophyllae]QEF95965.1 hypothetical protein E3E12_08730 [Formicincola oecophyllae]